LDDTGILSLVLQYSACILSNLVAESVCANVVLFGLVCSGYLPRRPGT
jgi:hypothetical protein